jgi:hypothetical protein
MQGSSTAFYNYRTSECPNPSVVEMHLHLYLFVYPSLRMPSIDPNPDSTPSRNDSQKVNSCAPLSYPPTKQRRGAALTAGASGSPTGQVDKGEDVIE